MGTMEIQRDLRAQLERARRENDELRKLAQQQNSKYNLVVEKYQLLQASYYALQQQVVELQTLQRNLQQYQDQFSDYLQNMVKRGN